ncbi:MAG: hypothetical protein ACE5G7_04560 [Candidatus Hydrothermarchaeaceae archaeon]
MILLISGCLGQEAGAPVSPEGDMAQPEETVAPQETLTPTARPTPPTPEEAIHRFYSFINDGKWDEVRAMTLDLNLDGDLKWNAVDDFYFKETQGGELPVEDLTIRDASNLPFAPSDVGASEGFRVDLTFVVGAEEFYSVEYWVNMEGKWKVII